MRREFIIRQAVFACALALACVAPAAARRQQPQPGATLSGRVTDARGDGVAGARVVLYSRERTEVRRSTASDDAGAYRFERLAPGAYLVEAAREGFARGSAREVSVARGSAASLDIRLEVAGVSGEVVVTASDAPQTVDEVSKAVTVVGGRELEERDEFSLGDALRNVPGLRVQQFGGPGSFTTFATRGLRSQDTALLVDGLRFRDPTAVRGDASGFLSDFVLTDAGRVEVLRGSGSSLYGTNAVGGVVNLVTDEGGGPFRGQLFAEGGGLGMARARAQVAGGAGEADRLVYSAAVSHLNVARGTDGDDAARNTSAQGRALLRLTPATTLAARVYASDTFAQLNENPFVVGSLPASGVVEARAISDAERRRFESGAALNSLFADGATFVPGANDPDNSRAGRFFSGALTFAHRPREAFGYALTYHALVTRNRFNEGPAGAGDPADFFNFFEPAAPTRNDFDGAIHTLNARTDFRLGAHNLFTAGYEFEHEDYLNRSLAASRADDSSVEIGERSHAFFIQDQLRFLDGRLQLSAAFRAQSFSLSAPRFTPASNAPFEGFGISSPPNAYTGDGSIAYLFRRSGTKLRAHAGNGYRKPSLFERFGTSFFAGTFGRLGDPRLAPDRSVAFDGGVDQSLASDRVRLSATYFYTRLQEVVDFGPTGAPDQLFGGYLNTGGQLARGVELSGAFAPAASLDLFASYTYTNSDQRQPQVEGVLRSFNIPAHQFSLVATGRIGRRLAVNFDLVASGDYLAPIFDNGTFRNRAYSFDGLLKADLTAGYTFPLAASRSLRLFGKIENLFDRDYFENGFRTPGVHGRAGAALNF